MHPSWKVLVLLLVIASGAHQVSAIFDCDSIAVDCKCRWADTGSYEQLGGLSKAPPATTDASAADCERHCCLVGLPRDRPEQTLQLFALFDLC
eukprot:SAG11_NODE_17725_length_510_cov_1.345499_2_plen_92_part_01